jgi:hypothetical protein
MLHGLLSHAQRRHQGMLARVLRQIERRFWANRRCNARGDLSRLLHLGGGVGHAVDRLDRPCGSLSLSGGAR